MAGRGQVTAVWLQAPVGGHPARLPWEAVGWLAQARRVYVHPDAETACLLPCDPQALRPWEPSHPSEEEGVAVWVSPGPPPKGAGWRVLVMGRGAPPGPLRGATVVLTRPWPDQAQEAWDLCLRGALVLPWPLTAREEGMAGAWAPALEDLRQGRYQGVAFTSARAAQAFLEALRRGGGDARWLAGVTVGAVGQATRAALAQGGVAADVVGESGGASLGEAMARALGPGGRLLLVQAEGGRPEAREVAVSLGIQVHTVAAYAMGPAPEEPLLRPRIKRALAGRGSVLFPWYSPRAVAEAAARLALGGARVRHVAVGATTAQAVREAWPRARVWTAARPEALAVQEALARAYGGEAGSARENQAKGGKACPYGSRWRAR